METTTNFPMIFLWLWLLVVPAVGALLTMPSARDRDRAHRTSDNDRLMHPDDRVRPAGVTR